jgi:hypothetical protein
MKKKKFSWQEIIFELKKENIFLLILFGEKYSLILTSFLFIIILVFVLNKYLVKTIKKILKTVLKKEIFNFKRDSKAKTNCASLQLNSFLNLSTQKIKAIF